MTISTFDELIERVAAGEPLAAADVSRLAEAPNILPLGMVADEMRRRLHGAQVTYARVAFGAFDQPFADMPAAARELRITGAPATLHGAVDAVTAARTAAGERTVSGFSWSDVERLAHATGGRVATALERLRAAGLDALAEVPLDIIPDAELAVRSLHEAGFSRLRLTIDKAPAAVRHALFQRASSLEAQYGCIQAINPLPTVLHALRPTTGYDDVKAVAIARLAAPNVPTIQVDWRRYGPKLAQVALTFGADDLDAVTPSDDAPDGRRRAPLEDVRRNIEAAGFSPAERDGRFRAVVR